MSAMPRPRRNTDPTSHVTIHIDPGTVTQIQSAYPDLSLGAAIERLWADRANPAPRTQDSTPKQPANGQTMVNPAPRVPVSGQWDHLWSTPGTGESKRQQCHACGAWRGTPKGDRACPGPK